MWLVVGCLCSLLDGCFGQGDGVHLVLERHPRNRLYEASVLLRILLCLFAVRGLKQLKKMSK